MKYPDDNLVEKYFLLVLYPLHLYDPLSLVESHNPYYNFLLIADEGWMLYTDKLLKEYNGKLPVRGMHGYDSNGMNMHAIFYAYGPKFKSGFAIDTFELIHVYPILCELLGIKPYKDIDGNLEVLQSTLK